MNDPEGAEKAIASSSRTEGGIDIYLPSWCSSSSDVYSYELLLLRNLLHEQRHLLLRLRLDSVSSASMARSAMAGDAPPMAAMAAARDLTVPATSGARSSLYRCKWVSKITSSVPHAEARQISSIAGQAPLACSA